MDVSILRRACKSLQLGSKAIALKGVTSPLDTTEYERLLALGIAADWSTWARTLNNLSYSDKRQSKSDRAYSLLELTRFTFMWTAANALFARTAITSLISATPQSSELNKFRLLYEHTALTTVEQHDSLQKLHKILSLQMHVKQFPWTAVNDPPTILEVIYFKYTIPSEQNRGLGRNLIQAIQTGDYRNLDLPTLIYATRNWNIHGVLLSSSFRGTRKMFNLWIDTINYSLAKTLEGCSAFLLSVI